jgi:hypothetical protein
MKRSCLGTRIIPCLLLRFSVCPQDPVGEGSSFTIPSATEALRAKEQKFAYAAPLEHSRPPAIPPFLANSVFFT